MSSVVAAINAKSGPESDGNFLSDAVKNARAEGLTLPAQVFIKLEFWTVFKKLHGRFAVRPYGWRV